MSQLTKVFVIVAKTKTGYGVTWWPDTPDPAFRTREEAERLVERYFQVPEGVELRVCEIEQGVSYGPDDWRELWEEAGGRSRSYRH